MVHATLDEAREIGSGAIRNESEELHLRLIFAFPVSMDEMRRAIERENDERMRDRFASTLVIAAAFIAAVRLAQ